MRTLSILTTLALFASTFINCEENVWTSKVGSMVCRPVAFSEPQSLQELQQSIKDAVAKGYRIRCLGNGYSVSPIVCTDGLMLSLNNLNHILSVDVEKGLVCAEAGISLKDLNAELAKYDLALPNQPAIDAISLGGGIATGVHGTGHTGILSSFVKSMQLVKADGSVVKLSYESDEEGFLAAKLNLGVLGVIYAVELQCQPLFYLKEENGKLPFDEYLRNYQNQIGASDYIQYDTILGSGVISYKKWIRCPKEDPDAVPCYKALPWFDLAVMDNDPFSEPTIALEKAPEFFEALTAFMETHKNVTLTEVGMRFVEQDDALLSNASDGTIATFHVKIRNGVENLDFYRDLENWLLPLKVRPHLGKLNFLDYKKAHELYGDKLLRFIKVKERFDPEGVFTNTYIDQLLSP